jgi:two-component system sensor histidine kinase/response regulator
MALILFVDDDPLTLEVLKKAVEIFGHQAILAFSGKEALVKAASASPDLILVDMRLNDMDGLSVVSTLRANPVTASIPAVILSAGQELDALERAQAAGAMTYLHKPVQLQALLDLIDQVTATHDSPSPQP